MRYKDLKKQNEELQAKVYKLIEKCNSLYFELKEYKSKNNGDCSKCDFDNLVKNMEELLKDNLERDEKYNELQDKFKKAMEMLKIKTDDFYVLQNSFDKMEEHYNSHMKIAEKEIKRLNVIIHYLESKICNN